jgi:hypothetical protein
VSQSTPLNDRINCIRQVPKLNIKDETRRHQGVNNKKKRKEKEAQDYKIGLLMTDEFFDGGDGGSTRVYEMEIREAGDYIWWSVVMMREANGLLCVVVDDD